MFRRQEGWRREESNADRVYSRTLGCRLRVVGRGVDTRLRIGHGPTGDDLFPTGEEAERAAKEQARAEDQAQTAEVQEQTTVEQERAAKEAALARVAELEAQLAERRRKDPK